MGKWKRPERTRRTKRKRVTESGVASKELCRKHGMAQGAFYKWETGNGGMEVNEAKRLRDLEDENRRLKKLVAEMTLDNEMLKERSRP